MKSPSKIGFALAFLVFGVYLMRNADVSLGTGLRTLYNYATNQFSTSAGITICPGVNLNELFSAADRSAAEAAKASIQSMRGGNPLKTMLTTPGGTNDALNGYVMPLIPLFAVWVAFFLISIVVCLGLCCSWCCMHGCCKNTKCCACCKQPKTLTRKWVFVGVSVVLLLGAFSAAIAGASFSGKIPTGIQLTLCGFIGMTEDFIYGVPSDKWLGLEGLVTNINAVLMNFNSATNHLTQTKTDVDAVNTAYNQATSAVTTLYNNQNAKTAPRAAADLTGQTYKPIYIAELGPISDETKFAGMIQKELDLKKDVFGGVGTTLTDAINVLQDPATTSGLATGRDKISEVSQSIQDLLKTLGDTGGLIKDALGGVGSGLTAIFIVYIVVSVLVIISIALIAMKKIKFLNKFLHFSWCVFMLLTIISWIIATILYPTSIIMMEGCDVIDGVINSVDVRTQLGQGLPAGSADVINKFTVCFGDPAQADIAAQFNIQSYMGSFDTIFAQLSGVGNNGYSYSQSSIPSLTIPPQLSQVNQFKDGTTVDSPEIATDLGNLNAAVNKNSKGACAGSIEDTWNLKSTSCTASDGTVYTGPAATQGKNAKTCIGFNQYLSPKTGTDRYSGTDFTSCSSTGGMTTLKYAQDTVTNFITNRQQISTLFTSVNTDLTAVKTRYDTMETQMLKVLSDFQNVENDLASIKTVLNDPNMGMIQNLRCSFLKTSLNRISDAMCTGFVANLYQTSVALIVTSFFTLFSAIAVFLLTKRILLPEYLPAKTSPNGLSPPVSPF